MLLLCLYDIVEFKRMKAVATKLLRLLKEEAGGLFVQGCNIGLNWAWYGKWLKE